MVRTTNYVSNCFYVLLHAEFFLLSRLINIKSKYIYICFCIIVKLSELRKGNSIHKLSGHKARAILCNCQIYEIEANFICNFLNYVPVRRIISCQCNVQFLFLLNENLLEEFFFIIHNILLYVFFCEDKI